MSKRLSSGRIALFGGTFNPIHIGHLLIAEQAREAFQLDRVIFLPAGIPPHKSSELAPAADRLAMARLAVRSHPVFSVSDWEIRQHRTVYTFETLDHFQQAHKGVRLFFIVGSDSLKDLPTWRQGLLLPERCTFLVAERPDVPLKTIAPALRRKVRTLPGLSIGVASRDLRRRIRKGCSIRYQVPDRVERYIRSRRLYAHA